jgi:hypothetical protein
LELLEAALLGEFSRSFQSFNDHMLLPQDGFHIRDHVPHHFVVLGLLRHKCFQALYGWPLKIPLSGEDEDEDWSRWRDVVFRAKGRCRGFQTMDG